MIAYNCVEHLTLKGNSNEFMLKLPSTLIVFKINLIKVMIGRLWSEKMMGPAGF